MIPTKSLQLQFSHINGHKPLMDQIRAIKRPSEILDIVRKSGSKFDAIHACTCLYEVVRRRKSFECDFRTTVSAPEFQNLVAFMADRLSKEMVPKTVANTAWALSELSRANVTFVDLAGALADRVLDFPDRFNSAELSTIVYSFGRMRLKHTRMLEAISVVSVWAIDDFEAKYLSNLIWGMAHLEEPNDMLMTAASKQYQEQVQTVTLQCHGNLAWAYAKLSFKDDDLMCKLAADTARRSGDLSSGGLFSAIHVLYACALSGIFHEPLMTSLVRRCTIRSLQKVNKWGICALLTVASKWPRHDDLADFREALDKTVAKRGFEDIDVNRDLLHPDSWITDGAYRPLQLLC